MPAMLLKCPRCSRVNPADALFCYQDGAALGDPSRRQNLADPARQRFPMPFVFPSGKVCHTFDELALAIQDNWDAARELMQDEVFTNFFAGLGRGDLAQVARKAAREEDADLSLDALLRRLPANVLESPKLLVDPATLNLGILRPGQDVRFEIHLTNRGMGMLTGSISCEDAPWLVLGDGVLQTRRKLIRFLHETTIAVHIRGKALAASTRPLRARLLIDSNGGQIAVPVQLEVPVIAFAEGVLSGAQTPRQIAQKAKEKPKEAADLFACGAVARWYEANGWTYPVQEPAASGLAAVQQFFEALGLTTPPRVSVSVNEIQLAGRGGEQLDASIQVVAQERKPVIAHAKSDQPWLIVREVILDGRAATVQLRVPEVPDCNGETLQGRVSIIANGRQRFVIPVHLRVTGAAPSGARRRSAEPLTEGDWRQPLPVRAEIEKLDEVLPVVEHLEDALPVDEPARDMDETPGAVPSVLVARYALAGVPVLFILFGLLVALVRDVSAWMRPPEAIAGSEVDLSRLPQELCIRFHDQEEGVRLSLNGGVKPSEGRGEFDTRPAFWEPSMRFGLDLCGAAQGVRGKRLTFDARGLTNNAVVRLDGGEWIFGERPFREIDGRYRVDWPGRWLNREEPLDRPLRDGRRSTWIYDRQQVLITQTVGLVPGAQSAKIDTCLVHYRIQNRDRRAHSVGLRFLLDTFIGGNDGVPFLIPGSAQLCNTSRELRGAGSIPDFIQARESEDLNHPGTIALIQLRIPGMEPPSRVTLGAWPNPELGDECRQEKTLWNVPLLSMKTLSPADSAVVIYWDERPLQPGDSREMAFAYGLGSVSAGETGGQLGLSVAGSFTPGGEFTLTAEARNPVPGQTLTLDLPEGFTLTSGRLQAPVPPLPSNAVSRLSPVTWRIKAGSRVGSFTLRVQSSTGVAQKLPVQIRMRGIFGS